MTDEELVGYCEIHCRTERAVFHKQHIDQLLRLAGRHQVAAEEWASYHEETLQPVIDEAKVNLAKDKEEVKVEWQSSGF
jgi:hypothetical protein